MIWGRRLPRSTLNNQIGSIWIFQSDELETSLDNSSASLGPAFSLDAPSHFSGGYVLPEPILYKALAPKFGMLDPELLMPIANFYGRYIEVIAHFPKVLESDDRQISYGVEWVLGPAIEGIETVQPTLRRIERLANLMDVQPAPDLTKARKAVEFARDIFEANE